MRTAVEIENIERMRRREGIHDVELRQAIRELRVGDCVKLTLLTGAGPGAGSTVLVTITRIEGDSFRGKLAQRPAAPGLADLPLGARLAFTREHIHSIPRGRPKQEK
jgi:hypothetical protein